MNRLSSARRKRLGLVLSLVFLAALVMGTGPGLYLINPESSDPGTNVTWLGVPVVYAWVILWFLVQAGVVLVAYLYVWNGSPSDASRERFNQRRRQTEANR